jgi:hypothetical protein
MTAFRFKQAAHLRRPIQRGLGPKPGPVMLDLGSRPSQYERVAESAVSPQTREIMLYLAKRWRVFADEADPRRSRDQQTQPRPHGAEAGTHENGE